MLRVLASAHALAIFAQPVSAGGYMSGDYDMLVSHYLGANVAFSLAFAQLIVTPFVWWLGGIRWPAFASLLFVAGETWQWLAGKAGALNLHVPLGVALFGGAVVMLVALWRPQRPVPEGRGE
jgi:hypothetical protein